MQNPTNPDMETNRLYRSRKDSMIGGVAGGLGEYFKLDPVIVRLIFVLLTLAGGGGVLIYILLWIFIPFPPAFSNPQNSTPMEEQTSNFQSVNDPPKPQPEKDNHHKGSLMGGLILITLGALFLAAKFIPHVDFGDLWPLILVVIGIVLLINTYGRGNKKGS